MMAWSLVLRLRPDLAHCVRHISLWSVPTWDRAPIKDLSIIAQGWDNKWKPQVRSTPLIDRILQSASNLEFFCLDVDEGCIGGIFNNPLGRYSFPYLKQLKIELGAFTSFLDEASEKITSHINKLMVGAPAIVELTIFGWEEYRNNLSPPNMDFLPRLERLTKLALCRMPLTDLQSVSSKLPQLRHFEFYLSRLVPTVTESAPLYCIKGAENLETLAIVQFSQLYLAQMAQTWIEMGPLREDVTHRRSPPPVGADMSLRDLPNLKHVAFNYRFVYYSPSLSWHQLYIFPPYYGTRLRDYIPQQLETLRLLYVPVDMESDFEALCQASRTDFPKLTRVTIGQERFPSLEVVMAQGAFWDPELENHLGDNINFDNGEPDNEAFYQRKKFETIMEETKPLFKLYWEVDYFGALPSDRQSMEASRTGHQSYRQGIPFPRIFNH